SGQAENCLNGVDDDGDGAVDCDDPDCSAGGFACAEAAPDGWSGPVIFGRADGASMLACPAPWREDVAAPACSACMCDPGGAACSSPATTFYSSQCSGTPDDTASVGASGVCTSVDVSGGVHLALGGVSTPTGQCAPSGGELKNALLCKASF